MNKQELIERLNNKLDETFAFQQSFKPLTWTHMECESKANAYMTAINYVEQLDEPQKVKVPEFVVEWFEENKHNLNFAIYELCEAGKVPVDLYEGLTDFERWFYLNHDIDTLIRMQDGYEVEEEPLFYIRLTIPSSSVVGLYLGFNKDGIFDHSYGKPHVTWDWKCTFTEKEIKSIDERYWAFAVPVEKV
ncbi:DUF1642 domain-containing protein [Enterococcus malodoratus]|uniref:DUF1642 domain-containing protein n=1 Tax=Enterococcus malodoratus TaxID=71451 RepID=UPI0022E88229|nr:DUF1642 domain-containing protein [Enterococcus malodoratus]